MMLVLIQFNRCFYKSGILDKLKKRKTLDKGTSACLSKNTNCRFMRLETYCR